LTLIFYDNEEVAASLSGLGRLVAHHPEWIEGDLALLLEPTDAALEAGCQGTLRAVVRTSGERAHAARSWLGVNAIHAAGVLLRRLDEYTPRRVEIDGCTYREGLSAVGIVGGVSGNVIPDECAVTVNYRFAPDRSEKEAEAHLRDVFAGYELEVVDSAPGALPGLAAPAVRAIVERLGLPVSGKYGWTDVARFAQLGIPAINLGPGDPALAHTRGEYVRTEAITRVAEALERVLFAVE
jgi:succinyl-diaminopimelate desuccinylase